jgi:hypothetical protein
MGDIEEAVKTEIKGDSTLARLALKLAREIDMDSGGVAAIRELRAILNTMQRDWRSLSPETRYRQARQSGLFLGYPPEQGDDGPQAAIRIINGKRVG